MIFQAASIIMRRETLCPKQGEASGRGAAVLGQPGGSVHQLSSGPQRTAAAPCTGLRAN